MQPDRKGYFDIFGGKYVPETLMNALSELEHEFKNARKDKSLETNLTVI